MKGLIYVEKSDIMDNSFYNYDRNNNDDSFNAEAYCDYLRSVFAGKETLERLFACATVQMVALYRCRRPADTVVLMLEHLTDVLAEETIKRLDREDSTGNLIPIAIYFLIGKVASDRVPAADRVKVFQYAVYKLLDDMMKYKDNKGGI